MNDTLLDWDYEEVGIWRKWAVKKNLYGKMCTCGKMCILKIEVEKVCMTKCICNNFMVHYIAGHVIPFNPFAFTNCVCIGLAVQ